MKMVRVDPWVKCRNLEIFKIWEGVSGAEPPLFPLLEWLVEAAKLLNLNLASGQCMHSCTKFSVTYVNLHVPTLRVPLSESSPGPDKPK